VILKLGGWTYDCCNHAIRVAGWSFVPVLGDLFLAGQPVVADNVLDAVQRRLKGNRERSHLVCLIEGDCSSCMLKGEIDRCSNLPDMRIVGTRYGKESLKHIAIEITLNVFGRVVAHEVDDEVMSNWGNETSEWLDSGQHCSR
jgi:hypothetical protein